MIEYRDEIQEILSAIKIVMAQKNLKMLLQKLVKNMDIHLKYCLVIHYLLVFLCHFMS